MNTITQYRPNYFDGFDIKTESFESIKQLTNIPWVKSFSTSPTFHRFSTSNFYLMAEYDSGTRWYIVGLFKLPEVRLPTWEPKQIESQNKP